MGVKKKKATKKEAPRREPAKPSDLLREAACLLKHHTWVQGMLWKRRPVMREVAGRLEVAEGSFCALGALRAQDAIEQGVNISVESVPSWSPAALAAIEALSAVVPCGHIPSFNDADATTKGDVIAMFKEAHDNLVAKGQ